MSVFMAVENGKTNVETITITCASNVFTPLEHASKCAAKGRFNYSLALWRDLKCLELVLSLMSAL